MPWIFAAIDMVFIWLALLIVFIVIEAVTVSLVSIWFALGSLSALIAAAFGGAIWLQATLFAIVSVATLLLTRPFVNKYILPKKISTNFERIIGNIAVVSEEISNLSGTGAVYIDGKEWSARSDNNDVVPVGTEVEILRIEGVKVIVKTK